ncbi:hypothetical protein L207DRAFT_521110 [Hyaloscypha variabilis F]|uniref:Heterokaryon incompatibility domain-containing protein n=1 Tax=Hyaloscypha variabilis (strain UAMH 11265 / GT02V1 / F) TaxID=1149755 RepID=A0A2J6QSP8_HYAVF|nr:hypothetical protein L207DRAFT_521380 [Hyaloscypha variabilis F]PMD29289.1 hypothetical protein L207DRAFT_521110 [Hyaloscypha variabilis F]
MDSTPTDKSISTKFGGPSPEYGNLMVERRSPNPEGKKDGRSLLKNEQEHTTGPNSTAEPRRTQSSVFSSRTDPRHDSQARDEISSSLKQPSQKGTGAVSEQSSSSLKLDPEGAMKGGESGLVESSISIQETQMGKGNASLAILIREPSKLKSRPSPSTLHESGSKHLKSNEPPQTKFDNFYSPQNSEFYSKLCYTSLNPEERRIRLLRIQSLEPGEHESSRIRCELIDNLSLTEMQGKFTTVSYCAGDPKETETILVNGLEFNAFSNLGHAFRQVRHFWKEKYGTQELLLWTDQICINQSNPDDRSYQVSFIGDIYGSAMQVLVCLSVEGDRSGGLQWLQRFSSKFQKYEQSQPSSEAANGSVAQGYNSFPENSNEESFHYGWDTFLAVILKSQWWPRAWIRQEYLRSPDAYFLAAGESMHWKLAAKAVKIYLTAPHRLGTKNDRTCPILSRRSSDDCQACSNTLFPPAFLDIEFRAHRLLDLKNKLKVGVPCSLDLLDNPKEIHHCEASNPKDLVYACFGISSHNYGLCPDYTASLSFEDVLIQVAQHVITHNKYLGILRHAYLTKRHWSRTDITSWVPDWRNYSGVLSHFHTMPPYSTEFFLLTPTVKGGQVGFSKFEEFSLK